MGGTTAKFCIIDQGRPMIAHEFEVDRRYIELDQPIKSVGDFTVPVRLPAETSALLKVTVAAE